MADSTNLRVLGAKSKQDKKALKLPYKTQLTPQEEAEFQLYQKASGLGRNDFPSDDYDERGQWKAMKMGVDPGGWPTAQSLQQLSGDGTMHGSDVWKTPYHNTFSNESKYATPNSAFWSDKSQLQTPGVLNNPFSANLRSGNSTISDESQFSKNLAVQQLIQSLTGKK